MRSFLLPQSGEAAKTWLTKTWLTKTWLTKTWQVRLAAQPRKSRQIRQALAQACGKILRQRGHAAGTCATGHFFRERLDLFGRGHAAAKAHRLRDAGHRAALAGAHGLHHVGHVAMHLQELVEIL